MSKRFSYVKYDKIAIAKQERFKAMFECIEEYAKDNLSATRERSLLLTALEEAYMWAGKEIRNEQIIRNGGAKELPERG